MASLLIGGVPLAPVMAFRIASPSMNSTNDKPVVGRSQQAFARSQQVWSGVVTRARAQFSFAPVPALAVASAEVAPSCASAATGSASCEAPSAQDAPAQVGCGAECAGSVQPSFKRKLLLETWSATIMVVKFMLLAYVLEALIALYVPQAWIVATLGGDQPFVIVWAALLGVPIYTSNLTAMPLISGLLAQGMSPAAALAFLIAGPTTTLPAMAAVAGLVTRRVFLLYVGFAFFGAIVAGYAYQLAQSLY